MEGVPGVLFYMNILKAPLEGSSRAAGEGWLGCDSCPWGHPSVTFGDSSPQGEPLLYTRRLKNKRADMGSARVKFPINTAAREVRTYLAALPRFLCLKFLCLLSFQRK